MREKFHKQSTKISDLIFLLPPSSFLSFWLSLAVGKARTRSIYQFWERGWIKVQDIQQKKKLYSLEEKKTQLKPPKKFTTLASPLALISFFSHSIVQYRIFFLPPGRGWYQEREEKKIFH